MPIATFNLHEEQPRIRGQVNGPRRWLLKIWVKGRQADSAKVEVLSRELRPSESCRLSELLSIAAEQIEEIMADLVELHDGGFEVFVLR